MRKSQVRENISTGVRTSRSCSRMRPGTSSQSTFPTVIATSPANGATAVLLNATVTATFSSVMVPATINTTTFTLTGPSRNRCHRNCNLFGHHRHVHAERFARSPTPHIPARSHRSAPIRAATPWRRTYVWTFTTGAPTVISTVPAGGATAVPSTPLFPRRSASQ